jgi:hypothetical protein
MTNSLLSAQTSVSAIAVFLRVYDHSPVPPDDGTRKLWQNFFVGKTINGYTFEPFEISDVIMNRTADEGGISLTCSPLQQNLEFFVASMEAERLLQVELYEMPVTSSIPTDLSTGTLIARFVGEIIGLGTDLTSIQVEVGAAIDAISGEIPGRRVTTSVVGRLPTL